MLGLFSKKARIEANIEVLRLKAEERRLKAQLITDKATIQRNKNSLATSKANAQIRKWTKQLEKAETIADMKDALEHLMPSSNEDHWMLQALDRPDVQQIVQSVLSGQPIASQSSNVQTSQKVNANNTPQVSQRERLFMEYAKKHPKKAEFLERELMQFARDEGHLNSNDAKP